MHLSRFRGWIVLAADVLLIFTCNFFLFLPALLRSDIQLLNLVLHIGFLTLCVLVFQLSFKTYESLWRYAESREYLVLLMGMSCGYGLYAVANLALRASFICIVKAMSGTELSMLFIRFLYRMYRFRVTGRSGEGRSQAAIIGAGTAAVALLSELQSNPLGRYAPWCLVDYAPDKIGKMIHGVPIKGHID